MPRRSLSSFGVGRVTELSPNILTTQDEVLLRQIPEIHFPDGVLSKQAFVPTPTDAGLLSTRREAVGAQRAYDEYCARGLNSLGTMGVTVAEVGAVGRWAIDDSTEAAPQHASIDMVGLTRGEAERAARGLRDAAKARDWLYGRHYSGA